MLDDIVKRYHGKDTSKDYEIRVNVDEPKGILTIWCSRFSEEGGIHPDHMGIARITENPNGFSVGWLRGTEPEPYSTTEFSTIDELFAALDDAIAKV